MNDSKLAVVSDIHGNADALEWTLNKIILESVELTIILGDLLTYGCQPNEVLDILEKYNENNKCIFIKGNHDQFYFDLEDNKNKYEYEIPGFVKESIAWTKQAINGVSLRSMFDWNESFKLNHIYFAHANPFEYGNWERVDTLRECQRAANEILNKGFKIGVFGHSHRAKAFKISKTNQFPVKTENIIFSEEDVAILNPGSIGQQRGEGSSFMILNLTKQGIAINFHKVDVDLTNYVNKIFNTRMSDATKEKLFTYIRGEI